MNNVVNILGKLDKEAILSQINEVLDKEGPELYEGFLFSVAGENSKLTTRESLNATSLPLLSLSLLTQQYILGAIASEFIDREIEDGAA